MKWAFGNTCMGSISIQKHEMKLWQMVHMGSISLKHDMESRYWIWDQYLLKKVKWQFGNFQLSELEHLNSILFSIKGIPGGNGGNNLGKLTRFPQAHSTEYFEFT